MFLSTLAVRQFAETIMCVFSEPITGLAMFLHSLIP